MLSRFIQNDDKYRSYAFMICNCHNRKNDLVNDMYIKLHDILLKDPLKHISNRYIYLMIRSIFINQINKKDIDIVYGLDVEAIEEEKSGRRQEVNDVLNDMKFFDREILLLTQEESLRSIAKKAGVHYCTVRNLKIKATTKFEKEWQKRNQSA